MSGRDIFEILLVVAVAVVSGIAGYSSEISTEKRMMQEAYERGYAVQCIGVEGYYWKGECPNGESK